MMKLHTGIMMMMMMMTMTTTTTTTVVVVVMGRVRMDEKGRIRTEEG